MKQDVNLARIPVCLFVQGPHDPSLVQLQDQGWQVPYALTKPVQSERLAEILRTLPECAPSLSNEANIPSV